MLSVKGLGEKTVQQILEVLDTKYPGLEQQIENGYTPGDASFPCRAAPNLRWDR